MRLHVKGDVFWLESTFAEKDAARQASFLWHGGRCTPGCSACKVGLGKVWWSKRLDRAATLINFADDEARERIKAHVEALEQSRAGDVEDVAAFDAKVPSPDGLEYMPFQRAGIAYMLDKKRTLLGDQMGLGKSIQAIGLINALTDIQRVLIIVPPTLRENWRREATKWLVDSDWTVSIANTPQELPDDVSLATRKHVIIVADSRIGGKKNEDMLTILRRDWDILIVDECHRFKHAETARASALLGKFGRRGKLEAAGLVQHADRLAFLSGTPLANRPIELFPLVRALDPDGLGTNFFRFAHRYCAAKQEQVGFNKIVWNFNGASNLDELQVRLRGTCMIRRLKADVLDLPPKRRQVVTLAANGAQDAVDRENAAFSRFENDLAEAQDAAEAARILEDDEAFKGVALRLKDLRKQMAAEMAKERQRVALAKAPAVVEHVMDALEDPDQKIILFCWHTAVVKQFEESFAKAKIRTVSLTGATAPDDKAKAVDAFQNDPSVRVFIGNIVAAGVGITLTAADLVIFAELDWVPANMLQAEDRAYRIGTTSSVLCQYLVFDGSVDAKMANALAKKMEIIEAALDRTAEPSKPAPEQQPPTPKPPPKKKYPPASDEHRRIAALAVQRLAAYCDGARKMDGAGFNRLDARFGHDLARRSLSRPLTDGEVFAAKKLTRKYKRQLTDEIFGVLWAADFAAGTNVINDLTFGPD